MRFLLTLAATAVIAAPGHPLPSTQSFVCSGSGISEGYPYGKQDTGPVRLLVTVKDGSASVIDLGTKSNFCPAGATCVSSIKNGAIALNVRDVPHYDFGYYASFRMALAKRTYQSEGGGLDGGWSQKGTCKAVRIPKERQTGR